MRNSKNSRQRFNRCVSNWGLPWKPPAGIHFFGRGVWANRFRPTGIEKITSEIKGLKARLASRDEGLQRKFYWLIIGALGLLVFMVLMVLGIVYVMNSVLFPVNQITGASSIKEMKLLYSWPNKDCAQNDKYAIINVWENTSSTPLQVYFENSLIGSDRAILNKTVSTAHFPPHAKSLDLD
jgi:hypothetical protein